MARVSDSFLPERTAGVPRHVPLCIELRTAGIARIPCCPFRLRARLLDSCMWHRSCSNHWPIRRPNGRVHFVDERNMRGWAMDDESNREDVDQVELQEEALRQRVCADLAKSGLLGEEAKRIADAIIEQLRLTGAQGYEDLIAGVRFSHQARAEVMADWDRMQRELRQLERLMSGFGTEIRKLDEVLEVLAAYVRRMRSSIGDGEERLLH